MVLFDYDVATQKYKRNIKSPKQLEALDEELRDATSVPPLLISVDQEGGRINRLKLTYGFSPSDSQQHVGTLNDLDFTHECAETTSRTLKSAGINRNLEPVVDLNVNPDNPIISSTLTLTPTILRPCPIPRSLASCANSSAGMAW